MREVFVLEEFERPKKYDPNGDQRSFGGPYLSVESNVYYRTNVISRPQSGPKGIKFVESKYRKEPVKPSENYLLVWGTDGLYKVQGDLSDSARIAPKYLPNWYIQPQLSSDESMFLYFDGTIFRFSDSSFVSLNALVEDTPKGTDVCGLMYSTFNPHYDEVLCALSCDVDEYNVINGVVAIELDSRASTVIDSLVGLDGCNLPAYSSDGLKISFVAGGKVYIAYRRGL
jgi:hypothetical protein